MDNHNPQIQLLLIKKSKQVVLQTGFYIEVFFFYQCIICTSVENFDRSIFLKFSLLENISDMVSCICDLYTNNIPCFSGLASAFISHSLFTLVWFRQIILTAFSPLFRTDPSKCVFNIVFIQLINILLRYHITTVDGNIFPI